MQNESKIRENLKFTDIQKLSQPISHKHDEILTGEIGFYRYRMDKILKEYCNFPLNKNIHALFEHGILFTDYCGATYRAHEYLPSIVASKFRVNVLKQQKHFNGAYTIGPYIHYAKPLLSHEELKIEKERLGKTLLVFPNHSIEGLVSDFNFESFCDEIKKISSNYDSVRICMYYKDVNLKRFEPYQKEGFEVVTAGHFNDYNFTRRLRSIIETSDMTMSNGIGSHLGYCIYLNKPHYLCMLDDVNHIGEKNGENTELMVKHEQESQERIEKSDNVTKIKQVFADYNEKITQDQYEIISYLWGFDEVKTPKELNKMFLEIENNYSSIKYYLSGLIRLKDIFYDKIK